jgi:coproporphyrinogen III oxidase-like Fe-S oxidoreductase
MEKKLRIFDIKYDLNWSYSVSIEQIKKDLIAVEKMGATHISIEPYEIFGEVDVHIEAEARRIETDEEYNERILEEQKKEVINKQYEIRTFNRIKAKYNL